MKPSYYLDSMVYTYLLEGDRSAERAKLTALVTSGSWRIFGSEDLLIEFARIEPEDRYRQHVELFWALVESRCLISWVQLRNKEVKKGTRLSIAEATATPREIAIERKWSRRTAGKSFLAEKAIEIGQAHREEENKRIQDIWSKLAVADPKALRADVDRRFLVTRDYVQEVFEEHFRARLRGRAGARVVELPCMSAFIALDLARHRRYHGRAKVVPKAGDAFDSYHYIYGAFAGCLVTRDRRFSLAIDEIAWRPVPVVSCDEFLRKIRRA